MIYIIRERECGNPIKYVLNRENAEKVIEGYEAEDKADGTYTEDFYEIVELDKDTLTYQVYYVDYDNGATSPFEVIEREPYYSSEDYVIDFEANADEEYQELLEHGTFRLLPILYQYQED